MQAGRHVHVRPGVAMLVWAAAATLVSGAVNAELTMELRRAEREGC